MERLNFNARTAGLAVCSAMAAAMLAGCAGHGAIASTGSAPMTAQAGPEQTSAALAKAEKRVERSPQNASARVELAQAYLAAGRFDSAATTFRDAKALGQDDARTGLGLALAYIGSGRNGEALAELARWRDQIPASDYGLALALAGHPGEGVAVLTDTVRGGDDNAKTRQNLAYAYALNGQWAQARVIAAQDVPADRLDARLSEWAQASRPQDYQTRVAGLLGAPQHVADPGQPVALALGGSDRPERMAEADVSAVPVAVPATEQVAALEELPPAATSPAEAPAEEVLAYVPPAEDAAAEPTLAVPESHQRFVSIPVVQPVRETTKTLTSTYSSDARDEGTHLVQLGSFRTREGAERAWKIFQARNPRLRDHELRITEADVRGRRYYRVAAQGFDSREARVMCSSIKQNGGGCFAYAENHTLPGTLPTGGRVGGPLRAR